MNNTEMDYVDSVIRSREIARSLAPAVRKSKTRPMMLVNDRIHDERKFARELQELDNYA